MSLVYCQSYIFLKDKDLTHNEPVSVDVGEARQRGWKKVPTDGVRVWICSDCVRRLENKLKGAE